MTIFLALKNFQNDFFLQEIINNTFLIGHQANKCVKSKQMSIKRGCLMTLVPVRSHRRNFSAARPEKEQGTDADSKGNLQEKRAKSKSTSSRHQSSQLGQNFSQVAFDTRKLDTKMHTKYFNKTMSSSTK